MKLEIACFDLESALITADSPADRIEFCLGLNEGGTTPSLSDFLTLKEKCDIPVYIMIRPRGGNFIYTQEELETMQKSISLFKENGADGFVFGVLTKNREIDNKACEYLVKACGNKPISFHRAIDHTNDIFDSVQKVIDLGFSTILTSGDTNSAMEGLDTLAKLQNTFGNSIDIMPGGGVRSSNIKEIVQRVKAPFYHSSAIKKGKNIASLDEIKALKSALNN